jgi:hypothetical protein
MLVDEIRRDYAGVDEIALEVDRYLTKSFFLRIRDVRNVEASSCLGGAAYNDVQIDQILLPLIAGTRHLWAGSDEVEPHASNGMTSDGGSDQGSVNPATLAQDPAAPGA